MTHKQKIIQAFSKSANTYRKYAKIQQKTAFELAQIIARYKENIENGKIIEIACGDGILAQYLHHSHLFEKNHLIFTDISKEMVIKCRQYTEKIYPQAKYIVMDVDFPAIKNEFSLIAINMSAQWFNDLGYALKKIKTGCKNNGLIALSMPIEESLHEWLELINTKSNGKTFHFLNRMEIKQAIENAGFKILETRRKKHILTYPNVYEFLISIKKTGAYIPILGYKSLDYKDMKEIITPFCDKDFSLTWHISYVIAQR